MNSIGPKIVVFCAGFAVGVAIFFGLESLVKRIAALAHAIIYPQTSTKTLIASDWTNELK